MTIIAGFRCRDGALLCADTQFTSDESKFGGSKIWRHRKGDLSLLAASAGDAVLIRRVEEGITSQVDGQTSLASVRDVMERVLKEIYVNYSDGVSVIVAAHTHDGFDLLEHLGWAVAPVDKARGFACLGSGGILGTYLAALLFRPTHFAPEAAVVAAHLLHEVKGYDPYCGFDSDIRGMSSEGGEVLQLKADTIKRLEMFFDDLYAQLRPLLSIATNAEIADDAWLGPRLQRFGDVIKKAPHLPFEPDLRRVFRLAPGQDIER